MSGVIRHTRVDADRHATLELPSGTLAAKLRLEPLRTALRRLGIDGEPSAGKAQLLDSYLQQVERVAEELRPPHAKRIIPLPQETMREAVAFIEKQASETSATVVCAIENIRWSQMDQGAVQSGPPQLSTDGQFAAESEHGMPNERQA